MSESLAERLKKAGIKQAEIAKKAKVSPAAISLVLRGKSKSARIESISEELLKKKQENDKN